MTEKNKKILIAAGGTGGHLYPGIALGRELKKMGCDPVFILRKSDISQNILKNEGFDYLELPVIGMPRSISFRFILFIYLLIKSYFAAKKILADVKPDVIFGMGSYVSFPVVFAGRLAKIKTIIHEQNFLPGLSNRILSRWADVIALSFEASEKYFDKSKVVYTGNPVRAEIFSKSPDDIYEQMGLSGDRFTILVFGGSQGAKKINKVVSGSLQFLLDIKEKVQFIHLTGKNDLVFVNDEYKKRGFKANILAYLEKMEQAYQAADLIICRSGATTVAELALLNKPAILIPFPYATNNHQQYNAQTLVDSHQAVMIKEENLTEHILAEAIRFQQKSFKFHTNKAKLPENLPQHNLANLTVL